MRITSVWANCNIFKIHTLPMFWFEKCSQSWTILSSCSFQFFTVTANFAFWEEIRIATSAVGRLSTEATREADQVARRVWPPRSRKIICKSHATSLLWFSQSSQCKCKSVIIGALDKGGCGKSNLFAWDSSSSRWEREECVEAQCPASGTAQSKYASAEKALHCMPSAWR